MRNSIVIYLNGKRLSAAGDAIFTSLAEFLRQRGLVGTKIGCGEGDCGACTVLVGTLEDGSIRYRTIASCIQSLYQLDGTHIVTIEGVAQAGDLSPIQQAMVDHHGSQCGFCTPGFVTALSGLFERADRIDEDVLREGLHGNLCRCTGYEPILEAALSVDPANVQRLASLYPSRSMYEELAECSCDSILIETGRRVFFRPTTLDEAVAFRAQHPGAVITAGGTELGVQRNKQGREPEALLSLGAITELSKISHNDGVLSVGANVTWARLEAFTHGSLPEIHTLTRRFGSPQIRNAATLVGNIAHGSPVADSLCFLMISLAELELTSSHSVRRVAISDFYTGYKKTVVAPDEIITRVLIPQSAQSNGEIVKLYKISKRKEIDVSTFRAGIRIKRDGQQIESAAIAYGGVGPTVRRLPATEDFLVGRPWSETTFREAGARARAEVEPISDVRGSRDFRLKLAENILVKFYHDTIDAQPRDNSKAASAVTHHARDMAIDIQNVHESARAHVTGKAVYVDDLPPFRNELLVEFVGSPLAHGRIVTLDVNKAAQLEGIAAVLTAADVPGDNNFGPIFHDEEVLAAHECHHIGQPIV
ncbi:MAG TPA: FAD binding domain-containing protein, partial [Isosphaeraceae bacterium]|nr:FAD binding domain-containing protein [Isosphaeraceae bacterium]